MTATRDMRRIGKNAHRGVGGRAGYAEPLPSFIEGVASLLPEETRRTRSEIIAAKSAAHARPKIEVRPYGMRKNGRAICPTCYRENGRGNYDEATGRCGAGRGCAKEGS